MISAKEAAQLVALSAEATTKRMEAIGEKIREAATNGKRELLLDQALPYNKELHLTSYSSYQKPPLTTLQSYMMGELNKNGYAVTVISVEHDNKGGWVPNTDPEDRQPYTTWHIKVSW